MPIGANGRRAGEGGLGIEGSACHTKGGDRLGSPRLAVRILKRVLAWK